jgi:hypothetical protein
MLDQIKRYFRSNPGTLFIIAFQALLVSAAALLVSGNSSMADEIAIYAFYALVIGIVIQIVIAVREERKRTRTGNSSGSPSSQSGTV